MITRFIAVSAIVMLAACSSNPAPASFGDDQVAIGYGKQARRTIAGAVNSITREDIARHDGRTLENLIRSRVPGAQIVRTGSGFNIMLRGPSSITGNNYALIVMDGVPLNEGSAAIALGALQPNDIQRIDVLKDGTAAIYGIRGANGVVVIETRDARN